MTKLTGRGKRRGTIGKGVNDALSREAHRFIAGGVNSPVRAFKGLGCPPVFIERAKGKYLFGADGARYLDYCMSWGSLILGHAHPGVVKAVNAAVRRGTSYGAPTRVETELARLIAKCMPSVERLRFVSSGTESVMTAVRLARAFTGRDMVLKFDGCYHGHSDGLLVAAGSGVAGLPAASSAGVPTDVARLTLSLPFNDASMVERVLDRQGSRIAAVLMEPVPANMGLVLPDPGFLAAVRELTRRRRVVLIFDEVISGFRVGLGGAQQLFGVYPDLTCLGKIIGGGFPVGAVGGRADIMKLLAPDGPVYQAGTLSGNPVAMTAGLTTLEYLHAHRDLYQRMESLVSGFANEWRKRSNLTINTLSSMFTIFQRSEPVRSFADSMDQDAAGFRRRFRGCLTNGIYLPPSRFETAFVSIAHTKRDLKRLFPMLFP